MTMTYRSKYQEADIETPPVQLVQEFIANIWSRAERHELPVEHISDPRTCTRRQCQSPSIFETNLAMAGGFNGY